MLPGMRAPGPGSFGALLRAKRERAGLTQQELAERSGLTTHAVSSLERGVRTRPYPHTVRALASALGASEEERARLLAAVPRRGEQAADATAEEPDAPRPVAVVVPQTPLRGREDDIERIVARVADGARLVTLTGPGGVGKTRLAAAAAEALAPRFPDGWVSLSLAPVTDAGAVVGLVARAVGAARTDGDGVLEELAQHLDGRRMLVVLDNVEHLLSAAPAIARLVGATTGPVVLATSRSPLRVRGEEEAPVSPLALPPPDTDSVEAVRRSPAGALLLDQVTGPLTDAGSGLTAADVRACAELCHRLAGLPLAIELAGARLRVLSPRALLDRLEEAPDDVASRDLPARQRTMQATLDWSHRLLDPAEQRLFSMLGVFRGGATLEAVEEVAQRAEGLEPREVLGLLIRLAEHSLVTVRRGPDGEQRFGMLEPVAQYARGLLVGDRAARAATGHAAHYLRFAEEAALAYERHDQVVWLARTEAEEANLLVAVERALDSGDAVTAGLVTWSLWLYWWLRGQFTVGRRLAERCLGRELPTGVRARVSLAAATMAYAGGDQPAAAAHWAHAAELAVGIDDPHALSLARAGTGLAALASGDLEEAADRFSASLDVAGRAEPVVVSWIVSLVHVWLGTVRLLQGDPAAAVASVEQGLALSTERGDRLTTYVALYNLAQADLAQGDDLAARRHVETGIRLSGQTGDLANLAYFAETLAVVEGRAGRSEQAAVLLGAAAGLRARVGADVYAYYLPDPGLREAVEASARDDLGAAAFLDARGRGEGLTPDEVIAVGLGDATPSDFR